MRAAATVARAALTAWTRETAGQVRLPVALIKQVAAGAVVLCLGLGILLALMAGGAESVPGVALGPGQLSFMLSGAFLTVAFLTALFSILAPSKNALATVLEMLPVSRPAVFAGLQIPVITLAYLLSFSLTIPSMAAIWRNSDSLLAAVAGTALLALFMFCSQVFILALFQVLAYAYRRYVRLPRYYALTFSGASCFVLAVALAWTDVLPLPSSMTDSVEGARNYTAHRVWGRAMAPLWTGADIPLPDVALGLLWIVIPALLMFAVSRIDIDNREDATLRLFANVALPRNRHLAAAWTDGVQLLRSHQFIVLILLLSFALGGVLLLSRHQEFGFLASTAAPSFAIAPFIVGLQSYGLTSRTHWIQRHLTAGTMSWFVPKLLACAVLSLSLAAVFITALFAAGLLSAEQWPTLIGDAAIAWGAAMIGGILVPFSREQPLASGATGFTVFLIYALGSGVAKWAGPGLGQLFGDSPYLGQVIVTTLVAVLLGGVLALSALRVSRNA